MASKFLNISTDTTLGGNSPSDMVVSSQKAVKTALNGKVDTSAIQSSVSSSSTNSQVVGAKLFYDTCGDIESAINTIRGV